MSIINLVTAPYLRYKNEVSSQDILKAIALLIMIIDHIGLFYAPHIPELRAIGRSCVPIWFFFVGYNSKPCSIANNQSIARLSLFALFLQITSYLISQDYLPLNVLFSMAIARIVLALYEQYSLAQTFNYYALLTICLLLFPLTHYLFEYGSIGILMAFWGYNYRKNIGNNLFQSLTISIAFCVTQIYVFNFGFFDAILSVILINLSIYALYNYSHVFFKITGFFKYIINISSRYSLHIYLAHVILLKLLNR